MWQETTYGGKAALDFVSESAISLPGSNVVEEQLKALIDGITLVERQGKVGEDSKSVRKCAN